ncbi:MAG TPA: regulatory protein RecX [Oscillospiraceae bacterium]|nr:regulatory protein RecX [Oscillospiraceae bacterium]HPF54989.1 regulatory protein RecX [Clostridiales bacterium]HPK34402.1 regulatory protein RecX [Oscillospiraceae bacterium]HPR76513.1 regulatory protein RecX [Oscillospiraceae bacterium]
MNKLSFQKQKHNLIVTVDDEPFFTAYAPVVRKQDYSDGDELSDTELSNFRRRCLTEDYLRRAYYFLGLKDYSKAGLCKKLGDDAEIAQVVVDGLESDGYLDDSAYAARRAQQLITGKKMSERTAVYTLISEGVDSETARNAIDDLDSNPAERITALLEGRYRLKLQKEDGPKKVAQALLRLGFRWDDIKSALTQYTNGELENGD